MIRRIVKMTFKEAAIEEFKEIFSEGKETIQSMPGCLYVEMLQDIKYPTVMFTLSVWEDEESLNQYRSTPYFKQVWSRTKKLFSDKAQAWSIASQEHQGKWEQ